MRMRITLQVYIFMLCSVYFSLLYVFYGRLQIEINQTLDEFYTGDKLAQISKSGSNDLYLIPRWKGHELAERNRRMLESLDELGSQRFFSIPRTRWNITKRGIVKTSEVNIVDEPCFMSARYPNRTFQHLNEEGMVYSAYLDERGDAVFVRIMAIFGNYKKQKLSTMYCQFDLDKKMAEPTLVQGSLYELCENHGKKYGGFIVSCRVPDNVSSMCFIGVYQKGRYGKTVVRLPVTRLEPKQVVYRRNQLAKERQSNNTKKPDVDLSLKDVNGLHTPYNYSICVPPLFGNLNTLRFVEFVETHRILGFQHFIFYIERISNPEILKVLNYYQKLDIATVIQWHLPIKSESSIWYYGQLNAHNDCMYRAMSLSRFVAIIDIDEAIVPHDGHRHINESIEALLNGENVCALSLSSAFYSVKFVPEGEDSDLITMSHLGRSEQFSNVRTKVLVAPLKIFEVGIHHVSKPLEERFKVLKVNKTTAFLHHYRKCVPNYGMKCGNIVQENSMLKYKNELTANVKTVFQKVLYRDAFQKNVTSDVPKPSS